MQPAEATDARHALVAILRGVQPKRVIAIAEVLYEAGIRMIEVPLNSSDPYASIAALAASRRHDCLIGAGTVLTVEDVDRLDGAGGKLLVTPNVEPAVISRARDKGMVTMPGVFTATEALSAARAGATGLKFFPAGVLGASGITAIRAVLPPELVIAAVGGVSDKNFADYTKAGILAFGLGTSLYKPGMTAAEVAERAKATIYAYDAAIGA